MKNTRDDQQSDERLMKELDRMYLRIADLEKPQAPAPNYPNDSRQDLGQQAKFQEKVIPFPKPPQQGVSRDPTGNPTRIPVISKKALEDKPECKRKPWYRSYLILPFPVIILLILGLIFTPLLIDPRNKEKTKTYQQTFTLPTEESSLAQKEDSGQKIEEKEQELEMQPVQTTNPVTPLTQKSHYTVQVGAFESWEITCNLLEELRDKGLECHWVEVKTINGDSLYRVFSGYFENSNEASEFMKKRGIVNDYPGSFVREIPSNEAQNALPPKANQED